MEGLYDTTTLCVLRDRVTPFIEKTNVCFYQSRVDAKDVTPVFSLVVIVLSHAHLLAFAASEQVWRGFGSFASGGRWAAASPRTPVFWEVRCF